MVSKSSTLAPVIFLVFAVVAARWWLHTLPSSVGSTSPKYVTVNQPSEVEIMPIEGAFGPESIAFDPNGDGPYVGVSSGRILKWNRQDRRWIDFAFTSPNRVECKKSRDQVQTEDVCGRPLGLRFHAKTGDLYIADAYMGLLVVGPSGGLATKLSAKLEGAAPLGFTNGLDIVQSTGVIYFTDSSTRYKRREYMACFLTDDDSGRLLKYDPETNQILVLIKNLRFPNGVSLSSDGQSLLLAESNRIRVLRYWLEGTPKAGTLETVVNLPGFPDNIKRNENGEYWVGIHSKKTRFAELILARPWVGNFIVRNTMAQKVAQKVAQAFSGNKPTGMGLKLSEEGRILEVLEDRSGTLMFVSEVEEKNGDLYFGSVIMPFLGVLVNKTA